MKTYKQLLGNEFTPFPTIGKIKFCEFYNHYNKPKQEIKSEIILDKKIILQDSEPVQTPAIQEPEKTISNQTENKPVTDLTVTNSVTYEVENVAKKSLFKKRSKK